VWIGRRAAAKGVASRSLRNPIGSSLVLFSLRPRPLRVFAAPKSNFVRSFGFNAS